MDNKNRRILFIVAGAYISGAEIITLRILLGLLNFNFNIHCLISADSKSEFVSYLKKYDLKYTRVFLGWYYIRKVKWSLVSLINYPSAVIKFIFIKKKFKPDLIYTITFRQIFLLYFLIKNNSVIYHVHDNNSDKRQSRFFLKIIDNKVKYYIAVSEFIKKDLIKCGINSNKILVVHNGISNDRIIDSPQIKLNNSLINIGIVGQIIPKKGHEVLIKSIKELKDRGFEIKLIIIGTGDDNYINKIKKLIDYFNLNGIVEFYGFIKNKENIYSKIDILVVPTQTEEPFGLVACEANYFGIPVIASNKGGLKEIIIHEYNGLLIDPYNYLDISEAIIRIINDKAFKDKIVLNGIKSVNERFTEEKMLLKIQNILNSI